MEKLRIAVLNTSKEITNVLAVVFREEGHETCESFTYLYRGDDKSFDKFIAECNPDVIIFDIAIPYEENYDLFKKLSQRDCVKHTPFILTTTNKAVLEKLVELMGPSTVTNNSGVVNNINIDYNAAPGSSSNMITVDRWGLEKLICDIIAKNIRLRNGY